MSGEDNDKVGYGRPPTGKQWQKGQCGNPRPRKPKTLDLSKLIDDFLAETIVITDGGTTRRITNFEAILFQLWTKGTAGSRRAANVFMKYMKFAASRGGTGGVEIRFNKPTNKDKL